MRKVKARERYEPLPALQSPAGELTNHYKPDGPIDFTQETHKVSSITTH